MKLVAESQLRKSDDEEEEDAGEVGAPADGGAQWSRATEDVLATRR